MTLHRQNFLLLRKMYNIYFTDISSLLYTFFLYFPIIRRRECDTESLSQLPPTNGSEVKKWCCSEEDQNPHTAHDGDQSASGNLHQGQQQQAQPGFISTGDDDETLPDFPAPGVQIRPDELQQRALRHICSLRQRCVQPGWFKEWLHVVVWWILDL